MITNFKKLIKHRQPIFFFYTILLLVACSCKHEKKEETYMGSSPDSAKNALKVSEDEMRRKKDYLDDMDFTTQADTQLLAFFEMDEKYHSDSANPWKIHNWKREKIEALSSKPAKNFWNVFANGGGGPAGSHWNGDADLFCVIFTKTHLQNPDSKNKLEEGMGKIRIYLNGKEYKTDIKYWSENEYASELTRMASFSIPQTDWYKALKKVSEKDLHQLFDSITISQMPEAAMANSFVKIEARMQNSKKQIRSVSGVFRIAYGE